MRLSLTSTVSASQSDQVKRVLTLKSTALLARVLTILTTSRRNWKALLSSLARIRCIYAANSSVFFVSIWCVPGAGFAEMAGDGRDVQGSKKTTSRSSSPSLPCRTRDLAPQHERTVTHARYCSRFSFVGKFFLNLIFSFHGTDCILVVISLGFFSSLRDGEENCTRAREP